MQPHDTMMKLRKTLQIRLLSHPRTNVLCLSLMQILLMRFKKSVMALWLIPMLFCVPVNAQTMEPVLIAGEDDWAPYSYADKHKDNHAQQPLGFSAALIREAFATQNIEVKFLTVPFARCMRLAKTEQVAGCFNATITDENRSEYIWHKPPMFREELSIFGAPNLGSKPLTQGDLRGKSVAITNGYTYPTSFMQDPGIRKFQASSDDNLIQMLLNRRVDYILLNRTPGSMRINGSANARGQVVWRGTLSADDFWVAFSQKHPRGQELANAFGKGLTRLQESGRYQRMLDAVKKQAGVQ